MQLLQQTQSLSWINSATDAFKLRSLILHKDSWCYRDCLLFAHPQDLYAVSYEPLGQHARFTVYGNQALAASKYQDAAHQLLTIHRASTDVLKGSAIPQAAVEPLTEVLQQNGWQRTYCQPCLQFTYAPRSQQQLSGACKLSEGYMLSELCQDDAPLVDSLWTFRWAAAGMSTATRWITHSRQHCHHAVPAGRDRTEADSIAPLFYVCRSDDSLPMIQQLISSHHTSCVRLADGRPVAWMIEVEALCGGMLHVLGEHRRQGLAKAVCLDLFSKLQHKWERCRQQQGDMGAVEGDCHAVYCYVVEGNTASMQLMQALQLDKTGVFTWLGFEKTAKG